MDFALDVKVVLTVLLLPLLGVALWQWTRPVNQQPAAAREVLTAVFVHAPVAVLWLDHAGGLQMANGQARTLIGLDANATRLPVAEWQQQMLEDVQAVLASSTGSGRSRTLKLPEQRIWHWWVTAWSGGGLVFVDDVTRAQEAEQATQLLLSDLAHELRTPLATLATHLEVLRLSTIAPEIRNQSLQFLREETDRLVRLVNNTLELGRLQSGSGLELRPIQLFPLVESVVAQLHSEAEAKGVAVSVEATANLPAVLGNADRLKQVLLNLLDNSIKYTHSGDGVVVTLSREAEGVACAVCDNGAGIAPEHLPYVTRRFYRAVPSGMPGNGLGLAVAAEIVRQHGAQLSVESKSATQVALGESTGTCARFVLPLWSDGGGA